MGLNTTRTMSTLLISDWPSVTRTQMESIFPSERVRISQAQPDMPVSTHTLVMNSQEEMTWKPLVMYYSTSSEAVSLGKDSLVEARMRNITI